MSKKLKILVIRFSSIGDIILTTPVIRCIKQQINAEIDYLTKKEYVGLLNTNPNIKKTVAFNYNLSQIIESLKEERYDIIIDLQNNLRSSRIKWNLKVKSYTVSKQTIKRQLLIYFGINLLKNHVVDRYFKTVEKLNIHNDNNGLDYFIDSTSKINYNINQDYVAWSIGGNYVQKRLSVKQIQTVINRLDLPVILLGGNNERVIGDEIVSKIKSNDVVNFCGRLSIDESAYLIKHSQLLLTNDTGMMHIGTCFDIPLISFWGCTKPSLGFSPYIAKNTSIELLSKQSQYPCSRHGSSCKFSKEGCIKTISTQEIYDNVIALL